MAERKCEECGQMISDKTESYLDCGLSQETQDVYSQFKHKSYKKAVVITSICLGVISCGASAAMLRNNQAEIIEQQSNDISVTDNSQHKEGGITTSLVESVQKYDRLYSFHQGLAIVEKEGRFGYINFSGDEVIPCQYEKAQDFVSSCAIVKKEGEYGVIDLNGNEIVPFEYEMIRADNNECFIVMKGSRYGCLGKQGNIITPCRYESFSFFHDNLARVKNNGLYGYISKDGKEVISCKYEYAEDFSEGLALISQNDLYGYIDKNGTIVVPCKYNFAQSFSEGLAAVEMADTDGISKGGYIDAKGNEVIPCKWNVSDGMHSFANGIAVVMDDQGFLGCINKKGKEVLVCVYGDIKPFGDRIMARESCFKYYNLFDCNGNEISAPLPIYDAVIPSESDMIIVVKNGKAGFINKNGKATIECKFDSYLNEDTDEGWIPGCSPFVEGISIVKLNGKYGAIDEQGNEIVPYIYDEIWDFSEKFAVARIADKWGYIDAKGNSTFSQNEIAAARLRKTEYNDEVDNVGENEPAINTQTLQFSRNEISKKGFSSWAEVFQFLPNKKFVSHDFYGYEYANELAIQGENGKLIMCINGVKIGEIGYDLRDKDKFNPDKIHMLLRVIETDYPMNGGVKRDYVFTVKVDKQRGVYLYFEPRLQENIFTHERFYEYYIPMFEDGKLNMNFSSANTYEECKFFYYFAVDK